MSYTFTYMLNIMWFGTSWSSYHWLPQACDRIMTQRRSKLYVIMLAVSLISNYIGFMMCIFLAFYAGYVIFEKFPRWPLNPLSNTIVTSSSVSDRGRH